MMQEIIELLKKEGFVDTLQRAVNVSSKFLKRDKERELYASKGTLLKYIENRIKEDENDELADKFCDFAFELAAEAIIKELDLKPDENYECDAKETFIAGLAKLVSDLVEDK